MNEFKIGDRVTVYDDRPYTIARVKHAPKSGTILGTLDAPEGLLYLVEIEDAAEVPPDLGGYDGIGWLYYADEMTKAEIDG
jgi:hypothetical protein